MFSIAADHEEILFTILDFCDEQCRRGTVLLSKKHSKVLTSDVSFKRRVEWLHIEHGVYHPPRLPPKMTWKQIFMYLIDQREIWNKSPSEEIETIPDQYNINVCTRFKPKIVRKYAPNIGLRRKEIFLPLHQRLALIRSSNKTKDSSNSGALKMMKDQGLWFGERWRDFENEKLQNDVDHNEENISVVCEQDQSLGACVMDGGVHTIDHIEDRVILVDERKGLREFRFDTVLKDNCEQRYVYDSTTMMLVTDFINGQNATYLVFGQTGSGKTYTMFTSDHSVKCDEDDLFDASGKSGIASWGIIPRVCAEIFQAIDFRKENVAMGIGASLSLSYIEIYGNEVIDLLRNGSACGHSRVAASRYVLEGSAEVAIESIEDVLQLLNVGEKLKRKGATAMNQRSSRAHTVLILKLTQKSRTTGDKMTSRMFLADLGGSEKLKKSQILHDQSNFIVEKIIHDGNAPQQSSQRENSKNQLQEAVYINLGLLALKNCAEALKYKRRHVPYADSKLTMMLSEGMGGNSRTTVLICGSQEADQTAETIDALKFGQSCGKISKTSTSSNIKMLCSLVKSIEKEISDCEEEIEKHERWEMKETTRIDPRAEGEARTETWNTYSLVGAELYRARLEELLKKQTELIGVRVDDKSTIMNSTN
mmetsp:Transcript_57494/g.69163  ORF Transcript_57494/g.69163 Transcript_57494/m.69163 type:complete len:649 (+) Transcript_57494:153-2099(+)